ncbi:MAG TPA: DinB family protein [Anaerolineales bacterium]|nr:DinB family protein [Anaerolineales bacterium]
MNASEYFDHWHVVWRDLLRGVGMLRDRDLALRPSEHYPRTVGGILRHIINLEQGWIHYVILRSLTAWPAESDHIKTVEGLRSELERVHKGTMEYLDRLPVEDFNRIVQVPGDGTPKLGWILWHVLEQEIHHRGELFLCLSLLGMERPAIDRPQ